MTQRLGVIGGSGFIGTWLVRLLLAQGHARGRAALYDACRGCDVLYNLAAEHRDDVTPVKLDHEVNVIGSRNTCDVRAT